jgi:hypothetical protein
MPTGTVTVSASTGESCSAAVATGSCSITFATLGSRTLVASYAGEGNFDGSPSPASIQSVLATPVTDMAVRMDAPRYVHNFNTLTYRIAVNNVGSTTISGGSVTDTLPPELDSSSATWMCLPLGTATCAPTGTGNLNDSSSVIPAGGGVVYFLTAHAPINAVVTSEHVSNTVSVSANGDANPTNDSATSTSMSVLFRDGFEPGGDGVQGTNAMNSHPFGSLDDEAPLMLDPASASQALYVSSPWLRVTDASGREVVRVDSLRAADDVRVRVISSDADGQESHSEWIALGAQPAALALADSSSGIHKLIVLGTTSSGLRVAIPSWATLPLAVIGTQ